MLRPLLNRLSKLARMNIPTEPAPHIRWPEVVRIEATGTDTFGPFRVWLSFFHEDGTQATLCVEHRGYDRIVESLHLWYPAIPPDWYRQMEKTPWHVERVLYSRLQPVFGSTEHE
jgi:hypothetical protein